MRSTTVIGLFLLFLGFMFLVLQPTYQARSDAEIRGIELESPLEETRPYPGWVAPLLLLSGGALMAQGVRRRR